MNSISEFAKGMVSEFNRVTWPSKENTWESTKVVVWFSFILVVFIFLVDQLLNRVVGFFIS